MDQPIRPSPPAVPVAAGLVFRGGHLLLARRPEGSHLAGLWEFPGGKLEPGESFEQALQRELMEELGVRVTVGYSIFEITHEYPTKTIHLRFFLCSIEHGEPQPLGCAELVWVERAGLTSYTFPQADDALIRILSDPKQFSWPVQ